MSFLLISAALRAQTFLPDWPAPDNGSVTAIYYDTNSEKVFVGGDFTSFGGQPRNKLAAIDAGTGQLLDWAPSMPGQVYSIIVVGDQLIVGGYSTATDFGFVRRYNAVSGVELLGWASAIDGGAVVDLREGDGVVHLLRNSMGGVSLDLDPGVPAFDFGPTATGNVGSLYPPLLMTMVQTASTRFVGGSFTEVDGASATNIAGMDLATGAIHDWVPDVPGDYVTDLLLVNGLLYIAGEFSQVDGQMRTGLAAISATTGALNGFAPQVSGRPSAMSLTGGRLYLGGNFTALDGFLTRSFGAVSFPSGEVIPWNPQLNASASVSEVHAAGQLLLAAGSFIAVEGIPKNRFAAWSLDGVGVAEQTAPAISLYPNPTSGVLHVRGDASKARTVVLHDLLGAQVATLPATGTVDISHLARGVYVATLLGLNNEVVGRGRVVLEK